MPKLARKLPLTTAEAAPLLKISQNRVAQLIRQKRLPAHKKGNSYLIDKSDLQRVKVRKNGRPPRA